MIFKSIKLKNFRQYKNEISFEFSQPKEGLNNITVLIAANGVGKTTLLQAFRYCFYGKSANYLNLPSKSELINNTIIDELKDLGETNMYVQVAFEHQGIDYIALREAKFYKTKSVLKEYGDETFSLTQLTNNSAYKAFREAEANDKIRSILPEGLSQIFMFDGERMERNISDKKFSSELKESILGILDIKKYDKLIDIIGSPGKSSSLLGLLTSKKRANTQEDKKNKDKYENLLENQMNIESDISDIKEQLDEIDKKININREQQIKLVEIREKAIEKKRLEDLIDDNKEKVKDLSKKYIKESKQALTYKLLLKNKKKYDKFDVAGKDKQNFYAYLHVDTLQDIQDKGICVCGRPVSEHTKEFIALDELKKRALPVESSQYINLIDQKFKQCAGLKEQKEYLNKIRSDIATLNRLNEEHENTVHILTQEIVKIEKGLGLNNQDEIETLSNEKEDIILELGKKENQLMLVKSSINNLTKKIEIIDKGNVYNQKVNKVIELVISIKNKLEAVKNEMDEKARSILARNFNVLLSETIHGKYDVKIDQKYHINIIDLGTSKDVTNLLNTGHNVVISLTFISALINTAKELSNKVDQSEKYGVLMDAALSNLDEVHIDRLCRNTLNNLDQLVFLSFKRQLRNEMYFGIKNNIGLAYEVKKNLTGEVYHNKLELASLSEYIHSIEEEER